MTPFLERLAAVPLVAILRAAGAGRFLEVGRVLYEAGVRGIEVTLTSEGALEAFGRLREELPGDALLGVGTVRSVADAELAVAAGAGYLVAPDLRPEVVGWAVERGLPVVPGALTPTEVARAARRCSVVKLFPASLGGPALLRALRGPFPTLAVVPTGGVTAADLRDWVAAGALAVGAGTDLCPPDAVERGDSRALEAGAARYMASFAAARDGVAAPGA